MNTISKHMTDEEIIRAYKNAESPKQMVGILCDRALVEKPALVNFLFEHNLLDRIQISAYVRHGMLPESAKVNQSEKKTSAKIPEKEKPANVPPAVIALVTEYLNKRREQYEAAKEIVNKYEELKAYLNTCGGDAG